MKSIAKSIVVLVFALATFSCSGGGGGGGSDPNAGFKLATYAFSPVDPTVQIPTAGNVQGLFLSASGQTTGTVTSFNHDFGGVGLLVIQGAKVPGIWRFRLAPDAVPGSLCLAPSIADYQMSLNSTQGLRCPGRFIGFEATPSSIDALNPPATITFTGKGLDDLYGNPTLAFYDEFGNVVAATQASQSLWSSGELTGIEVAVPDISQVYNGVYTIVVHNIQPDLSWEVVGAASVTIYGNPAPPPPPPPTGGCLIAQPPSLPC